MSTVLHEATQDQREQVRNVVAMNAITDAAIALTHIPGARISMPRKDYEAFSGLIAVLERVPIVKNGGSRNITDGCIWCGTEVVPVDL